MTSASDNISILVKNILDQANHYLNDAGEFYPFGAAISSQGELTPIGVYLENDFPKSNEVLEILENVIRKWIEDDEYKVAAVGIDVFIKSNRDGEVEKVSAVEVRLYPMYPELSSRFFAYTKEKGKYIFTETALD
jgi:hypothetical protein